MAVIDLKMAVEVDMDQLDKLQEKMKQIDEIFLKKIEKATTILPKGAEKVNHAWLQMVSKVGVYVDKFIDNIRSGIELICSKMDEMKNIIIDIRGDLANLEKVLTKASWIQTIATISIGVLGIGSSFIAAKITAGAALASIGSALGSLLLLLGEGALIVGTFLLAFKFTDWILEITGARKYIDDFMFWIVDNFLSIKDEIVDAINYLVDYPEERLNVFKQFMVNALDSIVEGIKSAFNKVWEFLMSKPQWSVDLVESIKAFFVDMWESISKSFTEGLSSAWGVVEAFFNKKIAWIKKIFDIGDFVKGIGKQIIDKFKQGLSNAWESTKKFFTDDIVNWIRKELQLSNSPPFTIPYECGLGIMAAYAQGMKENLPLLESTLDDITTKVETGLQIPVEAFASGSLTSGLGLSAGAGADLMPLKDDFRDAADEISKVNQELIEMVKALDSAIVKADMLSKKLPDLSSLGGSASGSLIKSSALSAGATGIYEESTQNGALPPPSAELDKYEIDYPEKAPKQGFFGGMKESFKSGLDDLKKQFGLGGDKGLLGNLFGGKDTGGGLFGMLGSLGGPQSGIVGMLQSVTSMIPGIGTMISGIIGGVATAFNALKSLFGDIDDFIKNINTHLFLFIKHNNLLPQKCFAKAGYAGTCGEAAYSFLTKECRVGIGYCLSASEAIWLCYFQVELHNLWGFQAVLDSLLFEMSENGLKTATQIAYI